MTADGPCSHWPVVGFQISAFVLGPISSLRTWLPLVASTLPSARMVALTHWRCEESDCVGVSTGLPAPVISITTTPFELPPSCRIRPGRNMAALPLSLAYCEFNCPTNEMLPFPVALT